jgi:transcriptional regulator with XRE-family HTH domain
MSFQSAYLTPRQASIWGMRRKGIKQADIARRLGVQRQGINRAFMAIDSKVGKALAEAARLNKLNVYRVDSVNGILEAFSPVYKVPVIISFSMANGVQVWYLYEGRCNECERTGTCRKVLRAEAEERKIQLSEEDEKLSPTLLARKIFSKYSGML